MGTILQLVLSGVAIGLVYAVIAMGYQLTFSTSRTLNFGQGEVLAVGALMGVSAVAFMPYPLALLVAAVGGFVIGIGVQRIAVEPALRRKSEFGWIMSTIALGIVLRNVAELVWGKDDRPFPSPVGDRVIEVLGARFTFTEVFIAIAALAVVLSVEYLLRSTLTGKAMDATSLDKEAAGLMGIDAGRLVLLSYGLSGAAAAVAGVIVAPLTLAGAGMGTVLGLKAFAVAAIGGLGSARGAILGGLILGAAEAFTAFYASTGYRDVPGLVLLLVVLAAKPGGLLGRVGVVKV